MNFVTVVEDEKLPLQILRLKYDGTSLAQLCEEIGEGRKRRFNRIEISGGMAFKVGWRGRIVQRRLADIQSQPVRRSSGVVWGFFSPLTGRIKLFPEAVWVTTGRQGRFTSSQDLLAQFHHQFYQALIEEIEHGYQDSSEKDYQSFWSKLVAFTSPAIPIVLLAAVAYIEFIKLSYWWLLVVFITLLVWIFLPVWVSLIPTPRWYQRLRYRFNPRENDAKGKAVSIRLIRQAREAIWFEPKQALGN